VRLKVVWFGRPASSPFEREVETYRQRVARRWPAEDLPLKPVSSGRQDDPRRALAAEAKMVRRHLPEHWLHVVLDERGRSLTSTAFAEQLDTWQGQGTDGVVFVVGSDLGVHETLKRDAPVRLALGPMTLPHLLARLVLWEQLFRATHILGGGGYHRHALQ
jgi:23S rRNA (pseudouridine1915-N3)-methyltransferase